jgi:putative tricarboxylic transport membrane protein
MLFLSIVLGTLYGMIIGIVPAVGATVGLTFLFGFVTVLQIDPYLSLAFITAAIASSTTADSISSILVGIPGANSSAATVMDGYPMTKKGEGIRAVSAAVFTSTVSGLLVGIAVLSFLPYYAYFLQFVTTFGIWIILCLSLTCIAFLTSKSIIRNIIAIGSAFAIGMIGTDPMTNADRFTFGWDYLGNGVQLIFIVTGIFVIPECIELIRMGKRPVEFKIKDQIGQGIRDFFTHWREASIGTGVGFVVGLIPGIGGAVSDWVSYSLTKLKNKNEKFGNGNVKGVIGPEGSNNAQKVTSLIPTILFGIPGASFAAIYMGLLMFLGFEVGTVDVLYDKQFTDITLWSFLLGTILVAILIVPCFIPIKWLLSINQAYVACFILIFCAYACLTYTGGLEDVVMFLLAGIFGCTMKYFRIPPAAFLVSFILFPKVETYTVSVATLYGWF